MNRPDAIFTDLDGTLLGPDKKIGERDAAAIRRLGKLGIPVIPCTGRPIQGARPVTEELELGLAVCSNGGCCHDFAQDKTLHTVGMDHGVAHRLMVWMEGSIIFSTPRGGSTAPRGRFRPTTTSFWKTNGAGPSPRKAPWRGWRS